MTLTRKLLPLALAPTLVLISAGLPAGAALFEPPADPRREPNEPPRTPPDARRDRQPANTTDTMRAGTSFQRAALVLGARVVGNADEELGTLRDALIDRGSGRIHYVLVRTSDSLGMDEQVVAVPVTGFNAFDAEQKRLSINSTAAAVQHGACHVPENWDDIEHTLWADHLRPADGRNLSPSTRDLDPYGVDIADAEDQTLNGRIVAVRRTNNDAGEDVIAVIDTGDGTSREIILGPSWYVLGHDGAPVRGDTIEARVRALPGKGDRAQVVASTMQINGRPILLRDANSRPIWFSSPGDRDNDRVNNNPTRFGRYILASRLIGANARPFDEDGGEIQDAVIELSTAQVVILCFDPNDNILGIADTIRCVPWSVGRVGRDGKVRFDATKDMLLSAQQMPGDVAEYSSPERFRAVYTPFLMETPEFTSRTRREKPD